MAPIQIVLKSRGVSAHSISNAMQLDEIGTRPARYWHTAHNDDVLTVLDQVMDRTLINRVNWIF